MQCIFCCLDLAAAILHFYTNLKFFSTKKFYQLSFFDVIKTSGRYFLPLILKLLDVILTSWKGSAGEGIINHFPSIVYSLQFSLAVK